jgi:hypothetical protein
MTHINLNHARTRLSIRDSDVAPREFRAANTLDMSAGARLGIVRSYGYGESRPELRPLIEGE